MLKRLILALPLALGACAADKPSPAPAAPPTTITLTVTPQEVNMIGAALAHRFTYEDGAPLIDKLQKQFDAQMPKPVAGK